MEMSLRERVIRFFILLCWLYAVFHCHDTLLIVVYSFRKSSTTRFVPFKQNITQESQLIDSRRHNHVFSTSNPGTMNIIGEMLPEIGYHIRRDCQRKGFAAEAAKAVMDWAFRNTDYPALYSYCKYTNEASIRTAESIGMQFDREYPDEANGMTHVSVIYRRNMIMNEYIAYCGLDCEACEARLATVNNDNELRIKVAKEWSKLNGVEITPEMINCSGCRIPGAKTVYCDSLCPIRQCAREKQMETCGGCLEMKSCEKVGAIIGNNLDARGRLENAGRGTLI